MVSEPTIAWPAKVSPVRTASVSPHVMPVSWVPEVQQQVLFAIPVDVLSMPLAVRFQCPLGAKLHREGVHRGGVKVRGGQDGHRDHAVALGVDSVRGFAGLDIEGHL